MRKTTISVLEPLSKVEDDLSVNVSPYLCCSTNKPSSLKVVILTSSNMKKSRGFEFKTAFAIYVGNLSCRQDTNKFLSSYRPDKWF